MYNEIISNKRFWEKKNCFNLEIKHFPNGMLSPSINIQKNKIKLKNLYKDKSHPLSSLMQFCSLKVKKDLLHPKYNHGELLRPKIPCYWYTIVSYNFTLSNITFFVNLLARIKSNVYCNIIMEQMPYVYFILKEQNLNFLDI